MATGATVIDGTKNISTTGGSGTETAVSCTWSLTGYPDLTVSVDKFVVEGFDIVGF